MRKHLFTVLINKNNPIYTIIICFKLFHYWEFYDLLNTITKVASYQIYQIYPRYILYVFLRDEFINPNLFTLLMITHECNIRYRVVLIIRFFVFSHAYISFLVYNFLSKMQSKRIAVTERWHWWSKCSQAHQSRKSEKSNFVWTSKDGVNTFYTRSVTETVLIINGSVITCILYQCSVLYDTFGNSKAIVVNIFT